MKGLVISLAVFVFYVVLVTLACHYTRPARPLKIFGWFSLICTPVYFLLHRLAPDNAWLLPTDWLSAPPWLDALYGYVVFALNAHSFMDFYFGFNGGLSMSILLDILRHSSTGMTADELADGFREADGTDKIMRRRFDNLVKMKMLSHAPDNGGYRLTQRGRRTAQLTHIAKRAMNLGEGG